MAQLLNTTIVGDLEVSGQATLGQDPNTDLEAATKQYVDAAIIAGITPNAPVESITHIVPAHVEGERYIVDSGATGDWSGHDQEIATSTAGVWVFETPLAGTELFVVDEGITYIYSESSDDWIPSGSAIDHGSIQGLEDDDHTQYHTDTRGDVRYNTKAEITTLLADKAEVVHTHEIDEFTTGTETAGTVIAADGSGGVQYDTRVEFIGDWFARTSYPMQMSVDGDTVGVANKVTTDRPAPQDDGAAYYLYDGTSPTDIETAKFLSCGQRYSWSITGQLKAIRIYTVAGNVYHVYSVQDPLGTPIYTQVLSQFIAENTGWQVYAITPIIIEAGTVFDLFTDIQAPEETPTEWTVNYNYTIPNNAGIPGPGVIIHATNTDEFISVNYIDDDGVNHGTGQPNDLTTLVAGDIISHGSLRWSIQSPGIDQGSYIDFYIAPAAQSSPAGVAPITFETTSPQPITVVEDVDHWSGNASVQGLISIDGADTTVNETQYTVDVLVQKILYSPDWDLLPTGSNSGAAGGGEVGPPGADGTKWYNGTSAPSSSLGVDGDFYINTLESEYYGPKAGASWPGPYSLQGPAGADGVDGVDGEQGPTGPTGAQGSTGPQGIQGEQGNPGLDGAPGTTLHAELTDTDSSGHPMTVIDGLISNGDGTQYLANNGQYQTPASGGASDPFGYIMLQPHQFIDDPNNLMTDPECAILLKYANLNSNTTYELLTFGHELKDDYATVSIPVPQDYTGGPIKAKILWWGHDAAVHAGQYVAFNIRAAIAGHGVTTGMSYGTRDREYLQVQDYMQISPTFSFTPSNYSSYSTDLTQAALWIQMYRQRYNDGSDTLPTYMGVSHVYIQYPRRTTPSVIWT